MNTLTLETLYIFRLSDQEECTGILCPQSIQVAVDDSLLEILYFRAPLQRRPSAYY